MFKTILTLTLAVTLVACAKPQDAQETIDKSYQFEVRKVQDGQVMKGRFYFIHGMGQNIKDLKTSQWGRMGDFMHSQNFEVVYIGWPFFYGSEAGNQGQDYVEKWQGWISNLDRELNASRPTNQMVIGGASMGAWHSILAAEVLDENAVFGIQPVVYLPILYPFSGYDTSKADLFNRALPNNIFITVGLADVSVGYWYSQELFSNLLPATNYKEYQGHIHAPYQDEFDDVMNWLLTQIQ